MREGLVEAGFVTKEQVEYFVCVREQVTLESKTHGLTRRTVLRCATFTSAMKSLEFVGWLCSFLSRVANSQLMRRT